MTQLQEQLQDAPRRIEDTVRARVADIRQSPAYESASAAAAVAAPFVLSALRRRAVRRGLALAPRLISAHPVVAGATAATIVGIALARLRNEASPPVIDGDSEPGARLRYRPDHDVTSFDLDEEVARMEDEGGEPSEPTPPVAGSATTR